MPKTCNKQTLAVPLPVKPKVNVKKQSTYPQADFSEGLNKLQNVRKIKKFNW